MRFSASVLVALVGAAAAAPTAPAPTAPTGDLVNGLPVGNVVNGLPVGGLVNGLVGGNDLVSELTGVVSQVENGLSVDDLEQKLDGLLGNTLPKVRFPVLHPSTT